MTKKRIRELADFFYSSNSSKDVPLRLAVTYGMGGDDLDYGQFIRLLNILNYSQDLKTDLFNFLNEIEDE